MHQKSQKALAATAVLAVAVAAALFLLPQMQFAAQAQTDHSPVFSNTETGIRRIVENTPPGTDIGDPFTATDEDSHTLTYLILDKLDSDSFDIGSTTGQLHTKAPLDYETKRSYSIVIGVHDSGQDPVVDDHTIDAALSVIILVTDVVEEGEDEVPPTSPCVSEGAVPSEADNPNLVLDCEALYTAKSTLTRTVTLNWALNTPISDWEGITVGGTPQRVTELSLPDKALRGTIPPILELLTGLQVLDLKNNNLTGRIPSGLGRLESLDELYLAGNRLTGCVPIGLKEVRLNDLSSLNLQDCQTDEPPVIPPVAIPSPIPTAVPPSPTPIAVSPSPTPTVAPPSNTDCLETIDGDGTYEGTWTNNCLSQKRPTGEGGSADSDYYARYFSFNLDARSRVVVTLESSEDTYLYLLRGRGQDGGIAEFNDDITPSANLNSRIESDDLGVGTYTIEATTYHAQTAGAFTLTFEITEAGSQPEPPPTQPDIVYTAISSGANHVCALATDGSIMCWGNEDGDSEGQVSERPTTGVFTEISSGDNHTCALRADGSVICWGSVTVP